MVIVVMTVALIYALPNIYPSDPSLQVSAARGAEVTQATVDKINQVLKENNLTVKSVVLEKGQVLARFDNTEEQLKAREVIDPALGDKFVTALNLAPATPAWLQNIGANPIKLGLDLRGGVHFLMEIDMKTAMDKNVNDMVQQFKTDLREAKLRYRSITAQLDKQQIELNFRTPEELTAVEALLTAKENDLTYKKVDDLTLIATFTEERVKQLREDAVSQNITIIRNRVNAIGVAEP